MKIRHIALKIPNLRILAKYKIPSNNCPWLLKFCQSDKISRNLGALFNKTKTNCDIFSVCDAHILTKQNYSYSLGRLGRNK